MEIHAIDVWALIDQAVSESLEKLSDGWDREIEAHAEAHKRLLQLRNQARNQAENQAAALEGLVQGWISQALASEDPIDASCIGGLGGTGGADAGIIQAITNAIGEIRAADAISSAISDFKDLPAALRALEAHMSAIPGAVSFSTSEFGRVADAIEQHDSEFTFHQPQLQVMAKELRSRLTDRAQSALQRTSGSEAATPAAIEGALNSLPWMN